jgi:hypothetical protein
MALFGHYLEILGQKSSHKNPIFDTRVVLKQNSQRFFSADLSCESVSHHFAVA